jgi:hypothetical protein
MNVTTHQLMQTELAKCVVKLTYCNMKHFIITLEENRGFSLKGLIEERKAEDPKYSKTEAQILEDIINDNFPVYECGVEVHQLTDRK